MTFKRFEEIVKERRPEVKVWKHNGFATGSKTLSVCVVFNYGQANESRVYTYNGTYHQVLDKLHINAVEQCEIDFAKNQLAKLEAEHGTLVRDLFGDTYIADNSKEITRYRNMIKEYESYVLV